MPKKKEQVAIKTKSVTSTQIMIAVIALAIAGGLAFAALPAKKVNFGVNDISGKCGVNKKELLERCGNGKYRGIEAVCHDGEEFTFGGSTSCKSSRTWNQLVQNACAGHCTLPPEEVVNCTDSDGGINYDEFGTVEYNLRFEDELHEQVSDGCAEDGRILERYCDAGGNAVDNTDHICQFGCSEGLCVARPASLEVSTINDLPVVAVFPGDNDVVLAHIGLDARESSEPILVSQVRVIDDVSQDARTIDIQHVRLMLGDVVLDSRSGSNSVVGEAQVFTFNISPEEYINVPEGESLDITLVGNISSNSVGGTHTFSLISPDTLLARGADSQNNVDETIENQTGQTINILVDSPELGIRPGTYNYVSPLLISGTNQQISSYIIHTSSTEPVELNELVLKRQEVAPGLSSPFDISIAYLYVDNREVSSAIPVGNTIHFRFADNDVVVTNEEPVEIFVRADLAQISPLGPVVEGGHSVGIMFESNDDLVAEGVLSGQEADVSASYLPIRGDNYKVYEGLPIFSQVPLPDSDLRPVTDLFKFSARSDERGSEVSFSKISFIIRKTGELNINSIEIYNEETNEELFTLHGDQFPPYRNNAYIIEAEIREQHLFRNRNYVVRGTVSGTGDFDDSIRTSVLFDLPVEDYNGKSMGTYQEVLDTGRAKTVWSDRHSQGHSLDTSDWANAYSLFNGSGFGTGQLVD